MRLTLEGGDLGGHRAMRANHRGLGGALHGLLRLASGKHTNHTGGAGLGAAGAGHRNARGAGGGEGSADSKHIEEVGGGGGLQREAGKVGGGNRESGRWKWWLEARRGL